MNFRAENQYRHPDRFVHCMHGRIAALSPIVEDASFRRGRHGELTEFGIQNIITIFLYK
jgi:hypothetical protein